MEDHGVIWLKRNIKTKVNSPIISILSPDFNGFILLMLPTYTPIKNRIEIKMITLIINETKDTPIIIDIEQRLTQLKLA